MLRRVGRLGNRRGQSVIEYLVVAMLIIGVILTVVGPLVKTKMGTLGTASGNALDKAATEVTGKVTVLER